MEQRKRESQIPKGTFGGQSVEDESLRGDLSGTFIRPVSETPPAPVAPIARIELRRQVAPPPPPAASRRSLPPPPPPPPSAMSAVSSESSLRALVAPSYPAPAPVVNEAERVEFPDYSLRLDIQPMAQPPASLLPMPGEERPASRKAMWLVPLAVAIGVAGWFSHDLIPSGAPRVVTQRAQKITSAPAAPVVTAAVAAPVVSIEPAAAVEAIVPEPVVATVPAAVVAPVAPLATKAKRVTQAEPVVAEPLVAEPAVNQDSAEHAPSLEAALVEEIPETLERAEVIEGIEILRNEYQACAGELHGMAELKITIANTGRISHALVGGDFAGTPQGSCLARTLRQARFRSFQEPRLDIAYPLAL